MPQFDGASAGKLPARFFNPIFAFFMSLLMSFAMSALITLVNLGFTPGFWARWLLYAFPSAWAMAFPIALFVVPVVRRGVARLVEH